jgi:nuclear protein NHN1
LQSKKQKKSVERGKSFQDEKEEEEAFDPLSKGDDLSDVSDLESHDGLQAVTSSPHKSMQEQLGETELDFEAEEKDEQQKEDEDGEAKSDGELKDGDNDLEEGECTDGEDARPEEESKPVCRFYNRGQCTWGANCR